MLRSEVIEPQIEYIKKEEEREENNRLNINIDILNNQKDLYRIYNICYSKKDKVYFYYREKSKYNWERCYYYLSGIFLTYYPINLLPFTRWKIENIKQRL